MTEESTDFIITVQEPTYSTPCLICGEGVVISDLHRYPIVCDECKRAIELVKSLYKNRPCWSCKDPKCGICNTFTIS